MLAGLSPVGMARYDDSYESLIARQLLMDPAERVRPWHVGQRV